MMHKLYWKIFLSFWLTSSAVIITTIWFTGVVTRQATIPARERAILNNYAHAAIATYESGSRTALHKWQKQVMRSKRLKFYLLSPHKTINDPKTLPKLIKRLQKQYDKGELDGGLIRKPHYYISSEILTLHGSPYRLVFIKAGRMTTHLNVPWEAILTEVFFAIVLTGLICYFLSHYLSNSLAKLCDAARKISFGQLGTRVSPQLLRRKDEIGELSKEFNHMAVRIESLVNAKQRLLQDISHELRSPLARLTLAIAIAQSKVEKSSTNIDFERMQSEIEKLDLLISEILSLAKLQSPSKQQTQLEFDLSYVIDCILSDAKYEFQNKQLSINGKYANEIMIKADQKLITRAIENIVRNACRYTAEKGSVSLAITTTLEKVSIIISDQGPGVPKEDLLAIFSAFYRVVNARNEKTGGYGIGLAITKTIIEIHEGNILARNLIPRGLEITIELPLSGISSS